MELDWRPRIMIVEDEQINAMLLEEIISREEYEYAGRCESGEESVVKCGKLKPDIVLMDINLAGKMDGVEAASIIKEKYNLPIIFITAYSDRQTLDRAKTSEPYGFIIKPFRPDSVVSAVEMAMYKSRMERLLVESERKYHSLFENMNEGFLFGGLVRQRGRHIDIIIQNVNTAFENIFSIARDDMRGKRLSELDFTLNEKIKKVFSRPVEEWDIFEHYHSGLDKWIDVKIYNTDADFLTLVCTDITKRKKVQEQLLLRDRAIEASITGMVITDMDMEITNANSAFLNMWGIQKSGDVLGTKLSDYMELKYEAVNFFAQTIKRGFWFGEINGTMNDGKVFPLQVASSLVMDSNSRPGNISVSFLDISERKKYEEEKALALAELDLIFNSTTVGMCLVDLEGNILRINDALAALFNVRDGAYSKCRDIICGDDYPPESCVLVKVKNDKRPVKFEMDLGRKGMESIICMVNAVPYLNAHGRSMGVLLSYTDITGLRRLEKEIMRITERERQTIGQDLHDGLGQKLAGLSFLTEALRQGLDEKKLDEACDAGEIKAIVDDCIDHTRKLARGLCPVNLESFGLDSALENLASRVRTMYNAECLLHIRGTVLVTDNTIATHLFYIASEAVNNALRHGKAGHIEIAFSGSPGGFALSVTDDGKGLGVKNGSEGLGLQIMKYRAEMIGAEFHIVSGEEKTTVSVEMSGE